MTMNRTPTVRSIQDAVKAGLTAKHKWLPSWLFYDQDGDALFQQIMRLPEYYLTACEAEILQTYSSPMGHYLKNVSPTWNVIELGAGDGSKTKILLTAFLKEGLQVNYHPVDISDNALEILKKNLAMALPGLSIQPIHADYLQGLVNATSNSNHPRLILFMGANIGNFEIDDASIFLHALGSQLRDKDRLLIGFDLMKSPGIIENAYHDKQGVTTAFNFNLLHRVNRELDADFVIANFEHWPIYDPVTGACRSYLVSKGEQQVNVKALQLKVKFKPWETIYTEISQKYSEDMISDMAGSARLMIEKRLYDHKKFFSLVMMNRM